MATKTIRLELDAYEKLCAFKRPNESFSALIRRATFPDASAINAGFTGADLLAYIRAGGSGISLEYLDSVEKAIKHDPPPKDPWA